MFTAPLILRDNQILKYFILRRPNSAPPATGLQIFFCPNVSSVINHLSLGRDDTTDANFFLVFVRERIKCYYGEFRTARPLVQVQRTVLSSINIHETDWCDPRSEWWISPQFLWRLRRGRWWSSVGSGFDEKDFRKEFVHDVGAMVD